MGRNVPMDIGSFCVYVNVSSFPSPSPPPTFLVGVSDSWILNEGPR